MVCTRLLSSPHRCATESKPAAIDSASDMSTLSPTASGAPAARSVSTAASSAGAPRAITATRAPSAARVSAIASPMPLLPPVTTAAAPAKPRSIALPFVSQHDTEPTPTESNDVSAYGSPVTYCGRPLPFHARPNRPVYRQRVGRRIDVRKNTGTLADFELLDKRLQDFAVGVCDQLRCREHLGLRLQRHLAQIGSDRLVEHQVQASVDPCHHGRRWIRRRRLLPLQPPCLDASHLQEDGRNQVVLRIELPIERPRAQLCVVEHLRHTDTSDPVLANDFNRRIQQGTSYIGVGGQLLAPALDAGCHRRGHRHLMRSRRKPRGSRRTA